MVLKWNRRDGRPKKTPFRSTMNQKDVIVLKPELAYEETSLSAQVRTYHV